MLTLDLPSTHADDLCAARCRVWPYRWFEQRQRPLLCVQSDSDANRHRQVRAGVSELDVGFDGLDIDQVEITECCLAAVVRDDRGSAEPGTDAVSRRPRRHATRLPEGMPSRCDGIPSPGTCQPPSTHNNEHATADESSVVLTGVPAGEFAGVYVADAVFVSGSNDTRIDVEQ